MAIWPFFGIGRSKEWLVGITRAPHPSGLPWSLPWGGIRYGRQPTMTHPERFSRTMQKNDIALTNASKGMKTGTPLTVHTLSAPGFITNTPRPTTPQGILFHAHAPLPIEQKISLAKSLTAPQDSQGIKSPVAAPSRTVAALLNPPSAGSSPIFRSAVSALLENKSEFLSSTSICFFPILLLPYNQRLNTVNFLRFQSYPVAPAERHRNSKVKKNTLVSKATPPIFNPDKADASSSRPSPVLPSANDRAADVRPIIRREANVSFLSRAYFHLLFSQDNRHLKNIQSQRFHHHLSASDEVHSASDPATPPFISTTTKSISIPRNMLPQAEDKNDICSTAMPGLQSSNPIYRMIGHQNVHIPGAGKKENFPISDNPSVHGLLPFATGMPPDSAFEAIHHQGRGIPQSKQMQTLRNAGNIGPFRTTPSSQIMMICDHVETRLASRLERNLSKHLEKKYLEQSKRFRRENAASNETSANFKLWKDHFLDDNIARSLLKKINALIQEEDFRRGEIF